MKDERILTIGRIHMGALALSMIQIILTVIFSGAVDMTLKLWLLFVALTLMGGMLFTMVLSRNDPEITQVLSNLAALMTGFALGLSVLAILEKVKNG